MEGMNAVNQTDVMKDTLATLDTLPRSADAARFDRLALEPKIILPESRPSTNGASANGEAKTAAPKTNNNRRTMILGALALVVATAVSVYYLRFVAPYESTDDAFIDGH